MIKKALITGITGQDGSYLAELLLSKGYEVHGIIRRSSVFNTERIDHIIDKLLLHYGDISDVSNINYLVSTIRPDELYNLAAQSHVKVSFEIPEYTAQVDALGTLRLLEAIRIHSPATKFYQASSSELYGKVLEIPQSELTPFNPQSPYAIAKLYSFWIIKNYRDAYGLYAVNGILFNHESERRGKTFVTRKISVGLSRIKLNQIDTLTLGNLESTRDWGYAPEYVHGMWQMLQLSTPEDFVLATGKTTSVKSFVDLCASVIGIDLVWQGCKENEIAINKRSGKVIVRVDPKYYRPTEVEILIGDSSKARRIFGWNPNTNVQQLAEKMIIYDYNSFKSLK